MDTRSEQPRILETWCATIRRLRTPSGEACEKADQGGANGRRRAQRKARGNRPNVSYQNASGETLPVSRVSDSVEGLI